MSATATKYESRQVVLTRMIVSPKGPPRRDNPLKDFPEVDRELVQPYTNRLEECVKRSKPPKS